ncbi:MAG TPA: FAD-binding oxidoreductase [Candidatus Saccharimonadales bacterium]|nr:FAD-binding oxidoreductase [Candidatus Saccharimonadales bacterium]
MGFLRLTLPVIEKSQDTPDVWTLRLDLSAHPVEYKAGQFVEVGFPGEELHRAFSISSSPSERGHLDITVRRLPDGRLSPRLCDAPVGQVLDVKGPFGVFTYAPGQARDLLLVAGGTGVAPFRAMIKQVEDAAGSERIRLLYSVRTPHDVIYRPELERWVREGRIELTLTATRGANGSWPHGTGRFPREAVVEAARGLDPLCFLCGPKDMLVQTQGWLLEAGLERKRVKREAWG